MKVNMQDKYETDRDGEVRILCVDAPHPDYPVVGVSLGNPLAAPGAWTAEGKFIVNCGTGYSKYNLKPLALKTTASQPAVIVDEVTDSSARGGPVPKEAHTASLLKILDARGKRLADLQEIAEDRRQTIIELRIYIERLRRRCGLDSAEKNKTKINMTDRYETRGGDPVQILNVRDNAFSSEPNFPVRGVINPYEKDARYASWTAFGEAPPSHRGLPPLGADTSNLDLRRVATTTQATDLN